MTDTIPALRIGAIAEQTGLAEATLRAWERRYGIPLPERTTGGHRLYGAAEVTTIRQVLALIAQGYTVRSAARTVRTAAERVGADDQAVRLERAASIMDEATSGFVLTAYGLEGLRALVDAGWQITPPREPAS